MSFLLGLVGKRVLPYLIGVFAVGLVVWMIYDNGYDNGVAKTTLAFQTAIEEERIRQQEANKAALEEAKLRQEELESLLNERNSTIKELEDEAADDANANERAIGPDSVRRINRIH